jgi:hypothetical protein
MDFGNQHRKVVDETRAHCSVAAERAITGTRGGRKAGAGGTCLYRRWLGWTVAGEAAGFTAAAIAGALAATHDLPTVPEFALLVGAGSSRGHCSAQVRQSP